MMFLAMRQFYLFAQRKTTIIYTVKWVLVFLLINFTILRFFGAGIGPFAATFMLTLGFYIIFNLEYVRKFTGEMISIVASLSINHHTKSHNKPDG